MKAESATTEKNYGIELLRILSMLSIMVLHVLGQGGVLSKLTPLSDRYEIAWFLEITVYFGVTVYALISGYVGVDRRFHVSNIVYVWLQVLFYTVLVTAAFALFLPGSVGSKEILGMIFPVMTEQYWYYSAYIGMFFFIPMMNHAMQTIYPRYAKLMFIAFIILFSVLPVFFDTDVYGLRKGYSVLWLMICYFAGAYVKKYEVLKKVSALRLWGLFFLSVLLTWGYKFVLEFLLGYSRYESGRSNMLIAYNSPTILLSGVALLVIFSRIDPKGRFRKVIAAVAPLCFGVYLSNCHPLIWQHLVKERFARYATYPLPLMLLEILLAAFGMFLCGIAVDAVRYLIFEGGHLRQKLRILEDRLFPQRDNE